MEELQGEKIPRGKIGVRLIFTLIYLIIFYVIQFVVQALSLIQFIILLITRSYSEPLRNFSNQASTYVYRLVRYITLNDNARPFPFSEFPPVIEPPDETVRFD